MKSIKFLFRSFDFLPNEVIYLIYKYVGNILYKNKIKYQLIKYKTSRAEKYFLNYYKSKNIFNNDIFPNNSI